MTDDLWSYGTLCGHVAGTDLTGWRVEASDGHVGEVDEHSDETGDAYLVLDAGAWIFGKLLIPASAVARVDARESTVHLGLSREQVEDAPQFLSDKDLADPQYREDVVAYYYRTGGPCPDRSDTV